MTRRRSSNDDTAGGDGAISKKSRPKTKLKETSNTKLKEFTEKTKTKLKETAKTRAKEKHVDVDAVASIDAAGGGGWRGARCEKSSVRAGPVARAVALAAAPMFPNSIKWSDENLIAVASGHTVTIFNPASLSGPRGFISISPSSLFDIGTVKHADLQTSVLLPFTLQRDNRVNVRCIDWSPQGAASNGGCLLAVCTTDHRVKLFRAPCKEYQSEWIEVIDLSRDMHDFCMQSSFMEVERLSLSISSNLGFHTESKNSLNGRKNDIPLQMQKFKHRKKTMNDKDATLDSGSFTSNPTMMKNNALMDQQNQRIKECAGLVVAICDKKLGLSECMPVEVLKEDAGSRFWIRGSLVKLLEEKAFVHYDAPISENILKEWVPLFVESGVSTCIRATCDRLEPHSELTSSWDNPLKAPCRPGIRPLLEIEDVESNCKIPAVGELVETWINERWQEGILVKIDNTIKIVDLFGCGQLILESVKSRPAPEWNGEKWLFFKAEIGMDCKKSLMGVTPEVSEVVCLTAQCRSQKVEAESAADMSRNITDTSVTAIPILSNEASKLESYMQSGHPNSKLNSSSETNHSQKIPAAQYVARSHALAAIVLSWSPRCRVVCIDSVESLDQFRDYTFLAVGTKSGRVAFWRFQNPQRYSVGDCSSLQEMNFLGFWCAHLSWVTSVSWATYQNYTAFDFGLPQESLLLATGSFDGSVNLWSAPLSTLTGVPNSGYPLPWMLLRKVLQVDSVPVTSLSLNVCFQISKSILLAVGKGSGGVTAIEVDPINLNANISSQPRAHEQLVTGVCWTAEGDRLYTCGQDNSLQGWKFAGSQLVPLSFPDCTILLASGAQNTSDIPFFAVDSFYGVALSQSSLALAVVRGITSEATDQMYQSRSQKGVVQVLWLESDEQHDTQIILAETTRQITSTNTLQKLEPKITSSLKLLEEHKPFLVLWDILTFLSYVKNYSFASFFDLLLSKWLGYLAEAAGLEWSSKNLKPFLSKASCRQLQILAIFYRRLLLPNVKAEVLSAFSGRIGSMIFNDSSLPHSSRFDELKSELSLQEQFWLDQFCHIEHELRQRLFFWTLSFVLYQLSVPKGPTLRNSSFHSTLAGALRMSHWVLANRSQSFEQLVEVATQLQKCCTASSASIVKPFDEECTLCGQPVKFESLEVAYCIGLDSSSKLRHKSQRCAVSLQVCSLGPQWFCSCCARCVTELAPSVYFALKCRLQMTELSQTFFLSQKKEPLCPFCGTLMYKPLPEFLLTPSLV